MLQDIHRETWFDDLERKDKQIEQLEKEREHQNTWIAYIETRLSMAENHAEVVEDLLATKEGEIARLTTLLEGQAKRRR